MWVRGGHQQEAECVATSTASTTSKRVPSREAGRSHLQYKQGEKAEGATQGKQEQPGQYLYNLKQYASEIF